MKKKLKRKKLWEKHVKRNVQKARNPIFIHVDNGRIGYDPKTGKHYTISTEEPLWPGQIILADLSGSKVAKKVPLEKLPSYLGMVLNDGFMQLASGKRKYPLPPNVTLNPGEVVILTLLRDGIKIIRSLGNPSENPATWTDVVAFLREIPTTFPTEAEQIQVPKDDCHNRKDLRHLPFVTIDGEDAKDFDDAVFVREGRGNTLELCVSIADVSHFVRSGDVLDAEACLRGNSVYLSQATFPMLPTWLSSDLCSLKPNVDRLAITVSMEISPKGAVMLKEIFPSRIRSQHRLTYEVAERLLQSSAKTLSAPEREQKCLVDNLERAYQRLQRSRESREALELQIPEYRPVFKGGKVCDVTARPRWTSHRIIESMMIATNVAVAKILKGTYRVFRNHPPPDAEKIQSLYAQLEEPMPAVLDKTNVQRELRKIQKKHGARMDQNILDLLILKTQAQASYGPHDRGHFALQRTSYTHFTSPIRRYGDLLVHRTLKGAWGTSVTPLPQNKFWKTIEHINTTERNAMTAEYMELDFLLQSWILDRKIRKAEGTLSNVLPRGIFVQLKDMPVSVFIPKRFLPRGTYNIRPENQTLLGKGQAYQLGDSLAVYITSIDILRRRITGRLL